MDYSRNKLLIAGGCIISLIGIKFLFSKSKKPNNTNNILIPTTTINNIYINGNIGNIKKEYIKYENINDQNDVVYYTKIITDNKVICSLNDNNLVITQSFNNKLSNNEWIIQNYITDVNYIINGCCIIKN